MKKHIFTITIIIWIILDLWSKNLATRFLQDRINIIGDLLYLEHTLNPGIAFSITLNQILLKIITIFLIIWFFGYYLKEERKNNNTYIDLAFGLIIAWAIWNAIERIAKENVIDFIWVKYFSVFNLADSLITIGAIIYIIMVYLRNNGKCKIENGKCKVGSSLKGKGQKLDER